MNVLEAVIYDMDGLLIDSEPFWQESEIEVLTPLGVPLTPEHCMKMAGLRVDEVIAYWHLRHPWDVSQNPLSTVVSRVVDGVIKRVQDRGEALPGVPQSIAFFQYQHLNMAIASSSHQRLIQAVVEKLDLKDRFSVIHSAENERFGKPHPDVFIHTAEKLGVDPQRCLVLEDSLYGVIAAKAARMKCLAVPATHDLSDQRFSIADLCLSSLTAFGSSEWETLNR